MYIYVFVRKQKIVGIEKIKLVPPLETLFKQPMYSKSFLGSDDKDVQWIANDFTGELPAETRNYKQMSIEQILEYCSKQEKIGKIPINKIIDFLVKEFI